MIKSGNKVTLDYEGRLESGEIFDSSTHGDQNHPLTFEVGSGQVIPGFDNAVLGMKIGEEKEFSIEPENAYGPRDERLMQKVPKDKLPPAPEGFELKPGMVLGMRTPQGDIPVKIAEVDSDTITLDMNHPLAGKKLIFKIKVLKIE